MGFLKRTYNGRMKRKIEKNNKAEAITQILILVIATFAIAWMIGSEVEEVSAASDGSGTTTANPCFVNYCSGNKIYGGKQVGGNCVIDFNNLKETCNYGCENGFCKLKSQSSEIGKNAVSAAVGGFIAESTKKNLLKKL